MWRDRLCAPSCCTVGSTTYFADIEPDGLGSNHQDWTRLPLIGDASHLLNRGRIFRSAVCHALASRCLLLQEAMRGRKLQTALTAHMSVGALCVRSLCTSRIMFRDSMHVCCEWERCESTRKLFESRHVQKRGLGRYMFLHSILVPQLRPVINACCQASRRAQRAAKEEVILAQSALSFREAFGWLERCVPVKRTPASCPCCVFLMFRHHLTFECLGWEYARSRGLRVQPFVSTCTLHCFQVLAPSQLVALPAVPGLVP